MELKVPEPELIRPFTLVKQESIDQLFSDLNRSLQYPPSEAEESSELDLDDLDDKYLNTLAAFAPASLSSPLPRSPTPPPTPGNDSHSSSKEHVHHDRPPPPPFQSTKGASVATKFKSPVHREPADALSIQLGNYVEAIVRSTPVQELHLTTLGMLFHRGCASLFGDSSQRRAAFQKGLDQAVAAGKVTQKSDDNDVIVMTPTHARPSTSWTNIEKRIVLTLRDEMAAVPAMYQTSAVNLNTFKKTIETNGLNGEFRFHLMLDCEADDSSRIDIPNEAHPAILCDKSTYASLFKQAVSHLSKRGVVTATATTISLNTSVTPAVMMRGYSNKMFDGEEVSESVSAVVEEKQDVVLDHEDQSCLFVFTAVMMKHISDAINSGVFGMVKKLSKCSQIELRPPNSVKNKGVLLLTGSEACRKQAAWMLISIMKGDNAFISSVPSLPSSTAISDKAKTDEAHSSNPPQLIVPSVSMPPPGFGSREVNRHDRSEPQTPSQTPTHGHSSHSSTPAKRSKRANSTDHIDRDEGIEAHVPFSSAFSGHHPHPWGEADFWPNRWGDSFSPRLIDQPLYVYVDYSNCAVKVEDIAYVSRLAAQGRAPIKRRVVAGSCTSLARKQDLDTNWSVYNGYEAFFLIDRGETYIDDLLHAFITQDVACNAISYSQRCALGDPELVRPILVLFSNDTNDNETGVIGSSFPRCLQFAIDNNWSVEVWVNCPPNALSVRHIEMRRQYGDRFKIFFLREFLGGELHDKFAHHGGHKSSPVPPYNPLTDT